MKNLLVSILVLFLLSSNLHADTIVMLADEWCPYNCEPGSERPGFVIEIAQEIFKDAGHTVSYRKMNWARSVQLVREDKFNAIVAAAKTDAPDFVFPGNEQGLLTYVFYTKKGSPWSYSGIPSLKDQTLGTIRDYTYSEDLDKYILANQDIPEKVQVVFGDEPLEMNIRKLLAGRISTFIDDSMVTNYTLSRLKQANLVREAGTLNSKQVYIAFSPKDPKSKEYAAILSEGMDAMRKTGRLEKILESYGLKDWQ